MTAPPPRIPYAAGYRVPGLGDRILVAGARLVPLLVVLVGVPDALLTFASAHGIALPVSILTATVAGAVISVLSAARYVVRPTPAFGPVSMATSAATIAYLLTLWLQSTYRFGIPSSSVTVAVRYAPVLDLVLLVPALALVAGAITTLEDLRSPTERLPFDFPP